MADSPLKLDTFTRFPSSARSLRFSVTLKKKRSALALGLTVGTVVPIDASRSWYRWPCRETGQGNRQSF
jgi:hypothetical protein